MKRKLLYVDSPSVCGVQSTLTSTKLQEPSFGDLSAKSGTESEVKFMRKYRVMEM